MPLRFLLPNYIHICAIIMQYFIYTEKREVLQHEYSQPPIPPSPHFRRVVNVFFFFYELGYLCETMAGDN